MAKCEKKGEINRFGEEKTYNCIDYNQSEHKKNHNPNYGYDDYCETCKKWLEAFKATARYSDDPIGMQLESIRP
ncbi:hypothetical protein LCGC14_1115680 [marine sediment metagenome]|uniref:Uncharacterized protein n=1 Tax=marine sediment metagenome TaxID=412755 RepID=A0A0F9QB71_9ZZZZ